MPTTVQQLLENSNLSESYCIKWGTVLKEAAHGVYIISTSSQIDFTVSNDTSLELNSLKIDEWMKNAPNMKLYGSKPSSQILINQVSKFWLPDESILYIGKAEKQSLTDRVHQYYKHKVGKKSPHKGGYWLKLRSNLLDSWIHVIPCNNQASTEETMLKYFMQNVSEDTRMLLLDPVLPIPFANLQFKSGVRKKHGLTEHYQ